MTSGDTASQVGSHAVMSSHLISTLAANDSAGGGGALIQFGILLLIPFAMYFFMIRPQRRRMREQQELQRSITVGDEVVTTSGVYGVITGEDGDNRFWLEIDDDVQIRIARAAISGKASTDSEPAADEGSVAAPVNPDDESAADSDND